MNKAFYISLIFFNLFIASIYSNPFLQKNTKDNTTIISNKSPTPIRSSKQNENIVLKQRELKNKLGNFFYKLKNNEDKNSQNKIIFQIVLISFVYGLLHAIGPGHRKTIVFSLYLTRNSKITEPLFTGLILALLHGGCTIFLMLIFSKITNSIAAKTNNISIYLEGFSYLLVIITSIVLLIHETVNFIKSIKNNYEETSKNKNIAYFSFILSGLYPCPGAILVLILSFTLKVLNIGIISVLAMSLGMSIPIVFCGYLAWFEKTGLFKILKQNQKQLAITQFLIECIGYFLLIGFSVYISLPFFTNLF